MLMGVNRVSTSNRRTSDGSHLIRFPGDVQVNVTVVIGHGLSSLTEKEAGGYRHSSQDDNLATLFRYGGMHIP